MNKKYIMSVYDEKQDLYYNCNKLDDINDIYNFIGWLCNTSETIFKLTYLQYYNHIFDDLESYFKRVKENNNIIAKVNFNNKNFIIKLEEENNN